MQPPIFFARKNGVFYKPPVFFLHRAFRAIFRPPEAANEGLNACFFGLRHETAFFELLNLELSKNERKEKEVIIIIYYISYTYRVSYFLAVQFKSSKVQSSRNRLTLNRG